MSDLLNLFSKKKKKLSMVSISTPLICWKTEILYMNDKGEIEELIDEHLEETDIVITDERYLQIQQIIDSTPSGESYTESEILTEIE